MDQIEFNLEVEVVEKPLKAEEPNPMCHKYGFGPADAQCKTCIYLTEKIASDQKYYKCKLQAKFKNGDYVGRDYRLKWRACRKYKEATKWHQAQSK